MNTQWGMSQSTSAFTYVVPPRRLIINGIATSKPTAATPPSDM